MLLLNGGAPAVHSAKHPLLARLDRWRAQRSAGPVLYAGDDSLGWGELIERIAQYGALLDDAAVEPGARVAVSLGRGVDLPALLLAVWSRRAAYVPVDPDYPLARQNYILESSGAEVLFADQPRPELTFTGRVFTPGDLSSLQGSGNSNPGSSQTASVQTASVQTASVQTATHPEDLAYIIYTSGSTGNPKGVMLTQANVINFLEAMAERPGLSATDVLLAVTTISFDIHVLELFLPLWQGASVVMATRAQAMDVDALKHLIARHRITYLQATPATFRLLLAGGYTPPQSMTSLVGGEALPVQLKDQMLHSFAAVWNMYGPTETTVWSLCHKIEPADAAIYIGSAIANTDLQVVDEQLLPVAPGTAGELLIGGFGVARGYYNQPELTDEKFLQLQHFGGARYYRTGDLVMQTLEGLYCYLDRIDNQIKLRGFRMEPTEIQRSMETYPGIIQAAVVVSRFSDGDERLMGFYLGQSAPRSALAAHLAEQLPPHMIPSHFIALDTFPMTANFKVDRRALAALGPERVAAEVVRSAAVEVRDDLDLSLIRVWERALGQTGIGLDDNFFSLGGHSLLALQVVQDMRQATGLDFSPAVLFESPTLRSLIRSVGHDSQRAASVVRLNSTQLGTPLFCLCGVGIYQTLADPFANRRPVYAVFAQMELAFIEAAQASRDVHYNFGALVDVYVEAILRQGRPAKLSLVGLSFGGLVALEAARRLQGLGVEVVSVVMLDSYLHNSAPRSFSSILHDSLKLLHESGPAGAWARYAQWRERKRLMQTLGIAASQELRESAFDRALLSGRFALAEYSFDVLLIRATKTQFGFGRRPLLDYGFRSHVKGRFAVHDLPAAHHELLTHAAALQIQGFLTDFEAGRG